METLIEQYNNLLKLIANELVNQVQKEHPWNLPVAKKINNHQAKKALPCDVLHHCVYTIEVGELAKKNFLKFGFTGQCQYPEVGGRYLRLYGVLTIVYQQKLAIEDMLTLCRVDELEKILSGLNNSTIIDLCNKLGINASSFRSTLPEADTQREVYKISIPDLEVNKIKLLIRKFEFENYNLLEDLLNFDKKVELTLGFLIGEILKNSFTGHHQLQEHYTLLNNKAVSYPKTEHPGTDN